MSGQNLPHRLDRCVLLAFVSWSHPFRAVFVKKPLEVFQMGCTVNFSGMLTVFDVIWLEIVTIALQLPAFKAPQSDIAL